MFIKALVCQLGLSAPSNMASIKTVAVMIILGGVAHGGIVQPHYGDRGGATSSQNFVSLHYGGHHQTGGQSGSSLGLGSSLSGANTLAGENSFIGSIGGNGVKQTATIGGGLDQGFTAGVSQSISGFAGEQGIAGHGAALQGSAAGNIGLQNTLGFSGQRFGGHQSILGQGFNGEQGIVGIAVGNAGLQNIAGYSGQGFRGFQSPGAITEQSFGGEQSILGHGAAFQSIAAGNAGIQNIAGLSGHNFGGFGNNGGIAEQSLQGIGAVTSGFQNNAGFSGNGFGGTLELGFGSEQGISGHGAALQGITAGNTAYQSTVGQGYAGFHNGQSSRGFGIRNHGL